MRYPALFAVVLMVPVCAALSHAQVPAVDDPSRELRTIMQSFGLEANVRVELRDSTYAEGFLKVDGDSLIFQTLGVEGRLVQVAISDVQRLWEWRSYRRVGARSGAEIGATTGALLLGLAAAGIAAAFCGDVCPISGVAIFIGFGIAAGAVGGAILGGGLGYVAVTASPHWVQRYPDDHSDPIPEPKPSQWSSPR